jgi:hypothetical protein
MFSAVDCTLAIMLRDTHRTIASVKDAITINVPIPISAVRVFPRTTKLLNLYLVFHITIGRNRIETPMMIKRTPMVVCPSGMNAKNAKNAAKGPHSESIAGSTVIPYFNDSATISPIDYNPFMEKPGHQIYLPRYRGQ